MSLSMIAMKLRPLFIGLIAAVLAGCSQPSEPVAQPSEQTGTQAAASTATAAASLDTLYALGDRLARTTCSGARPSTEDVANPHTPGQIDRIETRECAAGSTTLYRGATTSNPDGLAMALDIRRAGAGLPEIMEIGQPIAPAITALGVPLESRADAVVYGLGEEKIDTLTLHHTSGRIDSVSWSWQFD